MKREMLVHGQRLMSQVVKAGPLCIYVYGNIPHMSMVNACHPRKLLKNMNIGVGTRNLGEKTLVNNQEKLLAKSYRDR